MLWWGVYMTIFTPKPLNISWHTSVSSSTRPNNSQAQFRSCNVPGVFPAGMHPTPNAPRVPAARWAQEHPGACSISQCKSRLVDHWREAWLFHQASETLQSVTEDAKTKFLPVSVHVPSTHATAFNFYSFVLLGHRKLCVYSSQSFLPARARAPWELCPEHICAKKKYF